jgi:hypothetical protein
VKKQTKQICPFVFWEKLADNKLLSRLTYLYNVKNFRKNRYHNRAIIRNIMMPQAYKLANIWVKGKYPHCSCTALESMNKQANCKATANPIFD